MKPRGPRPAARLQVIVWIPIPDPEVPKVSLPFYIRLPLTGNR